jgi:hypothetical protein
VQPDETGFHAQNLFLPAGEHEVVVAATRGDQVNKVTRTLTVVR